MLVRPSQIVFGCPRGSCWMTAFIRSFSLTRINDDRQVAHGLFDELFGTMARRRIEEQCVTRPHHVATVSVPITDFAREHIKKFDAGVTKMSIGKRVFAERDQIRFDPDLAVSANRRLIGTLSALASESSVASDGEIAPFSIFDNIPAEMPDDAASSAIVKSRDLRSRRTSEPIPASRLRGGSSLGASDPVRSSLSISEATSRPPMVPNLVVDGRRMRTSWFAAQMGCPGLAMS